MNYEIDTEKIQALLRELYNQTSELKENAQYLCEITKDIGKAMDFFDDDSDSGV